MSAQHTLPKPTIWRMKDSEATDHYGKPIHVYYDGADLRLDHPDIEKMTALLEPLFTSEQVQEFASMVAADARAARIAAQTENETLKARLAASGVAERRAVREAVLAEREACARVCDVTPPHPFRPSIEAAHAIRARGSA